MRRLVFAAAVASAVTASLVGFAGRAPATPPPRSVDTTLTGNVTRVWNANSCCVVERVFEGTATIPSLGRLQYTGTYDLIAHFIAPTPQMSSLLHLTLVAPNGGTIEITGASDFFAFDAPPPVAPWAITNATGRFAGLGASGTYMVGGLDTSTLTLSFAGTLTKG